MTVSPEFLDRRLSDQGLPAGGTTGQGLTKATDTDYEAVWADVVPADGSVTAAKLAAGAVTNAALADDSVTSAKIALGAIQNLDVATNANILVTKLAAGTAGQILHSNATPAPAWVTVTGDVTISNTGVTDIAAGAVANAEIATNAAIAFTKLANLTSGNILVGNASNVPTAVAVTGDVTISNTGVTAIAAGAVVNADLATTTGELGGDWNSNAQTNGFTNVTGGTFQRRWLVVGKTLHFRGWFTAGTATASGSVAVQLPGAITAITGRNQVLYGVNTATIVTVIATNATNTVTIYASNAGGAFAAGASLVNLTIQGTIQIT